MLKSKAGSDYTRTTRTEHALKQTEISIVEYILQLKRNGRADSTIERANQVLTQLSKLCDLNDPEDTKLALSKLHWENSTKRLTANILVGYYKFVKTPYEKPKYAKTHELPFIPTEAEIDLVISSGNYRTATRLQFLKETGARSGELDSLKWTNIDFERRTVYITAEKGSMSRVLPISNKLIAMLNRLPRKNDKVFPTPSKTFRKTLEGLRKRLSAKMHNPRLNKIHAHTFRHFKGTMEYHKTNDIYHVKKVLGHKSILNTILYINLESAIFQYVEDEWISKVAQTPEEIQELLNLGFEYVCQKDDLAFFRKRK